MTDGWSIPKSTKKKKNQYKPPDWSKYISEIKDQMIVSEFWSNVQQMITKLIQAEEKIDLISLGIGLGPISKTDFGSLVSELEAKCRDEISPILLQTVVYSTFISAWKNVQPMIRSLSGSRFSRHQFAFLLCLIECFPEKLIPTITYDPEFDQEDEKIIGKDESIKILLF